MFDVGAIVGRMVLDTEKWDKAVAQVQFQTKAVADKTRELGQEWIASGRSLDKLGNKLAMIGGLGLAPFALAIRNVAKENYALKNQLDQINDSFMSMQRSIAYNLMPWMEKLNSTIKGMADGFNQMNPALKKFIIDFAVVTSLLVIGGGIILKTVALLRLLSGAILLAAGNLAKFALANPFVAIVVGIGLAIFAFVKFHDQIMKFLDVMKVTFVEGFKILLDGLALGILKIAELFATLIDKIPFLPQAMRDANLEIREDIRRMMKGVSADMEASKDRIGRAWADLVGGVKDKVAEIPTIWSEMIAGMQKGIHDLQITYNNWGEFMKTKTMEIAQSMEQGFSNVFFNVMTNQFKGFKSLLIDVGNSVLRMIADIMARMVMALALKAALAPLTGGLSMLLGFADGTDEIQSPGLYKLHGGEKITPKYDSQNNGGKQNLTIYNLISSEAVALAMQSKAGQGVIVNAINANSLRNGVIRKEVGNR